LCPDGRDGNAGQGRGGGAREALKKPPRLFSQRRVRAGTGKAGGNARFTGAPRLRGNRRPVPCPAKNPHFS